MKKGIVFALLTAAISGFSIFYNKLVIINGIDPLIFNIIKNGGVAIILSLLLVSKSNIKSLTSLTRGQWMKLTFIGIIGGSIPFVLFFEGLKVVSAANANLVHKSLFIWTSLMAIGILGEKLNIWQIAGYVIVAIGNIFIFGLSGIYGNPGILLIFAATLLWSMENIIVKITLADTDYQIVAWGRMIIGSFILVVIALMQNKLVLFTQLTPSKIIPVFTSIILLSGYVVTLFKALKFAPVSLVTSILIIATPITNILSAIFVTGNYPQIQLINLILTILGIFFIIYFLRPPIYKSISTTTDK